MSYRLKALGCFCPTGLKRSLFSLIRRPSNDVDVATDGEQALAFLRREGKYLNASSEPSPRESCVKKQDLAKSYDIAMKDYARAVAMLRRHKGTMPTEDYDRLRTYSLKMRSDCESARLELDRHIVEHGC